MATKFFLATCNSKKTKHRDGEITLNFPVTASTQKEAKELVYAMLKEADPEQGTLDFFQVPKLSSISKEEYEQLILDNEAEQATQELEAETTEADNRTWPQLNNSGFYPKDSEGLMRSNVTVNESIAEILILQTSPENYVFGYRYISSQNSLSKPTNHQQGDYPTLEETINASIQILHNIAEFQSEHGEGADKEFASKVLEHDFKAEIYEQLPAAEEQMEIEPEPEANSPTLPNQTDIDVAVFSISETKRIEMAVLQDEENWRASIQCMDTQNEANNKGNIREFSDETRSNRGNAITLAMGHAGNWLFQVDEMAIAKTFFKGDLVEKFDSAVTYQIVLNDTAKDESELSESAKESIAKTGEVFDKVENKEIEKNYDPHNEYQVIVNQRLEAADGANLELSKAEFGEAGDKLKRVIDELKEEHGTNLNHFHTLEALESHEWRSKEEALKTFLNVRVLRSLMNELAVMNEKEPPMEVEEPATIDRTIEQAESDPSKMMCYGDHTNVEAKFTLTDNGNVIRLNLTAPKSITATAFFDFGKYETAEDALYHAAEWGASKLYPYLGNLSQSTIDNTHNGLLRFYDDATRKYPQLFEAIEYRLEDVDTEQTPSEIYARLIQYFTEHTNVDSLSEGIRTLKNPTVLWHSTVSINMVQYHSKEPAPDQDEIPSFHDWAKTNKGKSFDDYAETFNIEVEGATSAKELDEQPKPEALKLGKPEIKVKEKPVEAPPVIESKEPSNDPDLEVTTIADLPENYQNNENLALFMKGFVTDMNHVKRDPSSGRISIKTQYRIMKATEIWGPIGVGWGYTVLREWVAEGAPIIIKGEISSHFEQVHKCEIEFWYMHEGERVSFTQYGDTRKLYMARGGYFVHDDEVEKKSLSDALGKAMSMTGISADVYLGTYDGDELMFKTEQMQLAGRQLKQLEFDGQAAQAALDKAKTYTDKFVTAPSLAEIKRLEKLATTALEAFPTPDDESKRKREKAIHAIAQKAQEAIKQFNNDLDTKEQANA